MMESCFSKKALEESNWEMQGEQPSVFEGTFIGSLQVESRHQNGKSHLLLFTHKRNISGIK